MKKFRAQNYFYPIKIYKFHRLMQQAPFWKADKLDEWSRKMRKAIVVHAYNTVPYYRKLFDEHGVQAERADRKEVWEQIPTIRKEIVRDNIDQFISSDASRDRTTWAETSGSTGMKLRLLLDNNVNAAAFALFWRAWGSGGYWRLGQRHAVMKGIFYQKGWYYNRQIRALNLSSSKINLKTVSIFRDLIQRYHPRFIRGYPSAMYFFCQLLRQQGLQLHIPMIISGSETLYDFQRKEIESSLQGRLYNHYTHWERSASILECDKGNLHAQEDYGHHEILDSVGQPVSAGIPGEITVTGLHNFAMPLIRYRTGDIGMWATKICHCGQSFPVVENILGRQTDYILKPDGSMIAGTVAVEAFRLQPNLIQAQIIQSGFGTVEVRIVKDSGYDDTRDTQSILTNLHQRLGDEMKIDVRFCEFEDLERSPAGKIRQCFNRIPTSELSQIRLNFDLSWGENRSDS